MILDRIQLAAIEKAFSKISFKNKDLKEELFDHLCSVTENSYNPESSFEEFLEKEIKNLAPRGFKNIDNQITIVLNPNIFIMKKITYLIGFLAAGTLATGVLFKLMHWPGANVLLLAGMISLFMFFMPFVAYKMLTSGQVKNRITKSKLKLGMMASVLVAISVMFKQFHLMGANIIFVFGMVIFILGFLPLQFIELYKKSTPGSGELAD